MQPLWQQSRPRGRAKGGGGAADDADADVDPSSQTLYYPDTDTDGYGDKDDAGPRYCDPPPEFATDTTLATTQSTRASSSQITP